LRLNVSMKNLLNKTKSPSNFGFANSAALYFGRASQNMVDERSAMALIMTAAELCTYSLLRQAYMILCSS
jgi:hypothetical protein